MKQVITGQPYRGPFHLQKVVIPALCEYVCRFWPQLNPRPILHKIPTIEKHPEKTRDKQEYLRSLYP